MHDILIKAGYEQCAEVYKKSTPIGRLWVVINTHHNQLDCELFLEARPGYSYVFHIHEDVSDEERYQMMRQHAYQLFQLFQ